MTYAFVRKDIRAAAVAALQGWNLDATVDCPGDWTTQPEKLPIVLLRPTRTQKVPVTAASSGYTTTVVLELETRVDGKTAIQAQDAIERLDELVERALMTNHALVTMTQRIFVDTVTEINAEGRVHLAGTKWSFRFELVEVIDPLEDVPDDLKPVAQPLEGMNLHADLKAPFDAAGTYDSPPFPDAIPPAPRAAGPDGRDEGALNIDFPQ